MRVSGFFHAQDNEPKHQEITWERFSQDLGPHDYSVAEKDQVPLFSPAEYHDGAARGVKGVKRVWMFVADFDHLTKEQFDWVYTKVTTSGFASIVYSTWSHALDPWRIRVIMALTRPVLPEEWGDFWTRMNAAFGNLCDPVCKDPSRIYYVPCSPAGTEAANFYYVVPGALLDTDQVLGAAKAERQDPERAQAIAKLGEAWPAEGRHEAHLALSGGLLMSGVTNNEAVEILCAVAVAQDPDNEDRPKREATVEGTRARIDEGERVVGWTTLAKHVGADVAMFAKQVLEAPPKISRDQLKQFAKSLKRKQNDALAELGDALAKICDGEVYAEATNRSDVTLRLCNALGERFRDFDAQSIVEHFVASFQLIGKDSSSCPSEEDVVFAIQRKQKELKTRDREKKLAEMNQQSARIREAFQNGRSTPYTQAELASFGDIAQRWIIQRDKSFYLFFNGNYKGPHVEASVHNAMVRELAPASSAGVQLYRFTKDGPVFKNTKQLVDEYGTVADSVIVDLTAQRTTYDETRRCIIEAPCPLRPITPRYHADVDMWLRIMAGEKHYENLKTYLAMVTRLDVIMVALFLTGQKSVGKSLLPLGVSRLWTTTGPTSMEAAFDNFNDSILQCPLTLADEQLPKDYRGHTKNAELRLHIQQRERTIRRKHIPNGKLIGATRTIVAAHDISILQSQGQISENEVAGQAERYFHIPTNPEAAAYLASIDTFGRGWVDRDIIAEHCLWLRDNHPHKSQGRFYIKCIDEGIVRALMTGSGPESATCQWLVSFLLSPEVFHASAYGNLLVRVKNNELLVNVRGLMKNWDLYVGKNERVPPVGILSRALKGLSHPSIRRKIPDKKGTLTNYRVINLDNLFAWADNNGFATSEQLIEGLSKENYKDLTA